MRFALIALAVLCVAAAAAEASAVRFVSVDEGSEKDGVKEVQRSDSDVKKSSDDTVKKSGDEDNKSKKTVKSLDIEKSSGDGSSEDVEETMKKSADPEKPKIRKRDVRSILDVFSRNAVKKSDELPPLNIIKGRKLVVKALSIQRLLCQNALGGVIFAVESTETDPKEKDEILKVLRELSTNLIQSYDDAISGLSDQQGADTEAPGSNKRKLARADDISSLMTTINQRSPLALLKILKTIASAIMRALHIADVGSADYRADNSDLGALMELTDQILASTN